MKKSLLTFAMAAFLCGMQANADNVFTAANVEGAPGETVNIELKLASDAAVAGYQASFTPATGLTLAKATKTGSIDSKDWFDSNLVDTKLNVLFYNQECGTFTDNTSKSVFTVPVTIAEGTAEGEYNLAISNIVFSDAIGNATTLDNITVKVIVKPATEVGDINTDGSVDIDDLQDMFDAIMNGEEDLIYDVNKDGSVDIDDIQYLFDILMGNI